MASTVASAVGCGGYKVPAECPREGARSEEGGETEEEGRDPWAGCLSTELPSPEACCPERGASFFPRPPPLPLSKSGEVEEDEREVVEEVLEVDECGEVSEEEVGRGNGEG